MKDKQIEQLLRETKRLAKKHGGKIIETKGGFKYIPPEKRDM